MLEKSYFNSTKWNENSSYFCFKTFYGTFYIPIALENKIVKIDVEYISFLMTT